MNDGANCDLNIHKNNETVSQKLNMYSVSKISGKIESANELQ